MAQMEEKTRVRHRDEAVELIECYLQRRDLAPHGKLPSEREMCEMWGLNRATLRAALRRLIELGRIYSLKGSGTYVAPPKLERNLQDIKSTTESVRGAGHKLKTMVLEQDVIKASPIVAESMGIRVGQRILYLRRLRLLDGAPYMIETNYVNLEICSRLLEYDFREESLYRVLSYHNIFPCQGHESIGITYATDSEARHLQTESGDPLYFLTGVAKDQNGVPVEYFKSVARPDKVRFSSILRKRRVDPKGENQNETGSSGF